MTKHVLVVPELGDVQLNFVLDMFTVFQSRIFIRGCLTCPEFPIRQIRLRFGTKTVIPIPTYAKPSSDPSEGGDFFESVAVDDSILPYLYEPRLEIVFEAGATAELDKISAHFLGSETYWRVLNPLLDGMKKKSTGRLLEIGARARSGIVRREKITPPGWSYVGFDIQEGENVNVVGDAHELTTYFYPREFDAVFAIAVLEHLLMPWKFVLELNRVLKDGAVGAFVTHQAWPIHEEPWDFWRFSSYSWPALLNRETGFEIIETRMTEPAYLVPQVVHPAVAHGEYKSYQASVVTFRKIADTTLDWQVKISQIIDTRYPT